MIGFGNIKDNRPESQARPGRIEWIPLAILVIAAFLIRIYNLGSFPDTVLADEADNAQDAIRILYGQVPENGFFGLDWTSQPAFSIYKQAAFFAIFGFNIMALRLPSALISALALIPFYWLLRRQFSYLTSLLACILLATNVWYLNFSRSGWNIVDVCFFMLMSMLFLMLGLDELESSRPAGWKLWGSFAMAGLFCALGLYAYPAGRAITIATGIFFFLTLYFYRAHRKTPLLGFLLLFAVEAVLFSPEAAYIFSHWEKFNGRSGVVVILNKPDFQADPAGTMMKQLSRNLRGPWDGSVNNTPQYFPVGKPQLDRITGGLALLGMVLSFASGKLRKRPETWLWWLMLLVAWVSTQLLTTSTPNGARGLGYMPTFIYFAAAGLDAMLEAIGALSKRLSNRIPWSMAAGRLVLGLVAVLIVLTGYMNVIHYINWQKDPETRVIRYLYVTDREWPQWAAVIVERARHQEGILNVGQWRDMYPIADKTDPYNISP